MQDLIRIMLLFGILVLATPLGHSEGSTLIAISRFREPSLSYIVVVLMENRNYADIIGDSVVAPYLNRLANDYSLASNYFDVSNNFSLPNYMGLISGDTYSIWSGCNVPPYACVGWTAVTNPTIIDRIEQGGLSWKAYMESMPANCYPYDSGLYTTRHDPFVYLSSVLNDPVECDKVVPAGTQISALISDLGSALAASNLMWLIPNLCNDMHDCSTSTGDTYLSRIIPPILNSTVFRTQNAALFLTWDEGWGSNSTHVPAIWAGPAIKNNYTSIIRHNHYSFLKTLETVWHLQPLSPNDAGTSAMTEFFKGPRASFDFTPNQPRSNQSITFQGVAGGGAFPYKYNWYFGDEETATGDNVTHSYEAPGSYDVTLTVSDSFNNTDGMTRTLHIPGTATIPSPGPAPTLPRWFLGSVPLAIIAASAIMTFLAGIFMTRPAKKLRV